MDFYLPPPPSSLPSLHIFLHSSSPFISIPVCHHWDHRNLCVGRVPQILEETQTSLYPGLLHLLLYPGISHDHRGMGTDTKHTSMYVHTDATQQGHLSRRPATLSLNKPTDFCMQSEVAAFRGQAQWVEQESMSLIKPPLAPTASEGKIQAKAGFMHFISVWKLRPWASQRWKNAMDEGCHCKTKPWIVFCNIYVCLCVFVTEWDVHAAAGGHICSLLLFGHHRYLRAGGDILPLWWVRPMLLGLMAFWLKVWSPRSADVSYVSFG